MEEFLESLRGLEHDGKPIADMVLEHYGNIEALEIRVLELAREHLRAMGLTTVEEKAPMYPTVAKWVDLQVLEESGVLGCPDCKSQLSALLVMPEGDDEARNERKEEGHD